MTNTIDTTYKIKIEIEGPREPDNKSYSRPSVFSIAMESNLSLNALQKHAAKLFSDLANVEPGLK